MALCQSRKSVSNLRATSGITRARSIQCQLQHLLEVGVLEIKLTRDVIVLLIEGAPGDEDLNGHRNRLK